MQAKYAHLLIITECKNTKKEKIAKKWTRVCRKSVLLQPNFETLWQNRTQNKETKDLKTSKKL